MKTPARKSELVRVEEAEAHEFENPRGGSPYATIRVGAHEGKWFVAMSCMFDNGSGCGGPLGFWPGNPNTPAHPDKQSALEAGMERLRERAAKQGRSGSPHLAWLDELTRSLAQPDLFAF